MSAELPVLLAEKELRDHAARQPMSGERLYQLILASTGDDDAADKARCEYMLQELRLGLTPEGY